MSRSEINQSTATEFGYFGKYPGYADFVQKGLSVPVVKFWHLWVNNYMDAGQNLYQEQWEDIYLQSPVWRFYLFEPDIGQENNMAWLGAIMPSADKRGRFFPLLAAQSVERGAPISILRSHQASLDELETRLVECLNEPYLTSATLSDQFSVEIESHSAPQLADAATLENELDNSLSDDSAALLAIDSLFEHYPRAVSVWQSVNAASGRQYLHAYPGQPAAGEFAALQISTVSSFDSATEQVGTE